MPPVYVPRAKIPGAQPGHEKGSGKKKKGKGDEPHAKRHQKAPHCSSSGKARKVSGSDRPGHSPTSGTPIVPQAICGREEAGLVSGTEAFTTQACEDNPYGSPVVKEPPKASCEYPPQPDTSDPVQSTPVKYHEGPPAKKFRSLKTEDINMKYFVTYEESSQFTGRST